MGGSAEPAWAGRITPPSGSAVTEEQDSRRLPRCALLPGSLYPAGSSSDRGTSLPACLSPRPKRSCRVPLPFFLLKPDRTLGCWFLWGRSYAFAIQEEKQREVQSHSAEEEVSVGAAGARGTVCSANPGGEPTVTHELGPHRLRSSELPGRSSAVVLHFCKSV